MNTDNLFALGGHELHPEPVGETWKAHTHPTFTPNLPKCFVYAMTEIEKINTF